MPHVCSFTILTTSKVETVMCTVFKYTLKDKSGKHLDCNETG